MPKADLTIDLIAWVERMDGPPPGELVRLPAPDELRSRVRLPAAYEIIEASSASF